MNATANVRVSQHDAKKLRRIADTLKSVAETMGRIEGDEARRARLVFLQDATELGMMADRFDDVLARIGVPG